MADASLQATDYDAALQQATWHDLPPGPHYAASAREGGHGAPKSANPKQQARHFDIHAHARPFDTHAHAGPGAFDEQLHRDDAEPSAPHWPAGLVYGDTGHPRRAAPMTSLQRTPDASSGWVHASRASLQETDGYARSRSLLQVGHPRQPAPVHGNVVAQGRPPGDAPAHRRQQLQLPQQLPADAFQGFQLPPNVGSSRGERYPQATVGALSPRHGGPRAWQAQAPQQPTHALRTEVLRLPVPLSRCKYNSYAFTEL